MGSELMKIAEKHYENNDTFVILASEHKANELLNNFDEYPHAFVLGCIMDKQIPAPKAWAIPYKVYKELGNFNIDFLADVPMEKYIKMFKQGKYHRFNEKCAIDFYEAVHKIKDEYNGDASRIWSDNPTSKEVVSRFRAFKGVGPGISNMAANILARNFKIPMSDYSAIDISTDTHITRVMGRLYFNGHEKKSEIVKKAREINPEYPACIDLACRIIGQDYCHPTDPECHQCPLLKECSYNLND